MNRKPTQEQNDISLIIGNLPQRLQKKFVDEHGSMLRQRSDVGLQQATVTLQKVTVAAHEDSPKSSWDSCPDEETKIPQTAAVKSMWFDDKNGTLEEYPSPSNRVLMPGLLQIKATQVIHNGKVKPTKTPREHNITSRAKFENNIRKLPLPNSTNLSRIAKVSMPTVPWFCAPEVKHCEGLQKANEQFALMVQQNRLIKEWKSFLRIHEQLQNIFRTLILTRMKFCCEQKVDTYFWKVLFYNVHEHLRGQNGADETIDVCIRSLLDTGLTFYSCLETELIEKYLRTSPHTERRYLEESTDHGSTGTATKLRFIAKLTIQKVLIWQGDLCRYKIKSLALNDYNEARQFYTKAQRLVPTNGIPYNRLAFIAVLEHKQFDAVYYYMRSLMTSNSIQSAKENLLVLFDELRKKHETSEIPNIPKHQQKPEQCKQLRKEVWIYPDGICRLHRNQDNGFDNTIEEVEQTCHLTVEELLRNFHSVYLYILGKFYTGIGMELIQEHQRRLLNLLDALLDQQPLPLSRSKLLKLVALNIFAVHHNMEKDSRETYSHAFHFYNQFVQTIIRKIHGLLSNITKQDISGLNDNSKRRTFLDLDSLLLFANLYLDFFTANIKSWPAEENLMDLIFVKKLLELIGAVQQKLRLTDALAQGNRPVLVLPEDTFFSGFSPLNNTLNTKHPKYNYNCEENEWPLEGANENELLERLTRFQSLLNQLNDKRQLLFNGAISPDNVQSINSEITNGSEDQNTEIADEPATSNYSNDSFSAPLLSTDAINEDQNTQNSQIVQLNNLKKQLKEEKHVRKMHNEKLEEILNYVDTKVYIEVRPKYLLPDTNCFIDCIDEFEKLVKEFAFYIFIIPLTVVKELDGLSKGVKLESYERSLQQQRIHHFDEVSSRAKKSLNFIHKARNNIKCATTKGSIINASLFSLVEEEYVSNDDKILATALALSKTMNRESNKNGKYLIQTELVLITSDRNLRVKALTRNLAVSDLTEFMFWAKTARK